ncbi:Glutamate receptor 2.1 [Aphelenchoides fujianensis]|nr:Glutamate receptor 2.1 [Aphelenchoides fujianensis]
MGRLKASISAGLCAHHSASPVDGKADGMMGEVFHNYVDTVAYPFQKTQIRQTIFDFSIPLYYSECQVLHGKRTNQSNTLWTFFSVYDRFSWMIMGAILFLQALFYVGNLFCQEEEKITFRKVVDSVWLAVQIELGQATTFVMRTFAVKFNFLFVSLLQGVIVMGVYSSWILSQKLSLDKTGDLNSFSELVDAIQSRQRYFVSTTASDWFYESLNKSEAYPYNSLRAAIRNNPVRFTRTQDEVLEEANSKGGLIALMQDDRLNLLSKTYCNLVTMDTPVSVASAHLLFRRGSPLIPAVNEAIAKNQMLIYFGLCIGWGALMTVATAICLLECLVAAIRGGGRPATATISPRSIVKPKEYEE